MADERDDPSKLDGALPGHLFANYRTTTALPEVGQADQQTPEKPAEPSPTLPRRRGDHEVTWRLFALCIAIGLWINSLLVIDTTQMDEVGLVDVFPITFFVALGLLVVGFVGEVLSRRSSSAMLIAYLVALVFVIHGTVPMIFPEPHYAWVYKHFGVTAHLDATGQVSPTTDIYQNWPGFFALTSWLDQAGGIAHPIAYGAWAQVFFNLVYLLQLGFIFRALTENRRVVWLGLFLFVATSWVGQDYFAPQAFVFVLVLALYAVVLRWLANPESTTRLSFIANRLVPKRSKDPGDRVITKATLNQRQWAIIGACFLFFVISASHQLTPYMVIGCIGLLTLFGFVRYWSLVFLLGAVAFFYLLPHLPFVIEQYGIFSGFDPVSNAQSSNVSADQGEEGRLWVASMARLLSALIIGLAVLGFVRRLFQGQREIAAGLLMVGPMVILAGQSYGGEAIYRVYLLALPFAVYLAAHAIAPRGDNKIVLRALRPLVPLAAAVTLLIPAYFGLEHLNEMRPGEVEAGRYFYENAPPGSTLLIATPNFPTRSEANYDQFRQASGGDIVPDAATDPNFSGEEVTDAVLQESLQATVDRQGPGEKFLVLTRAQREYGAAYGSVAPEVLQQLDVWLVESDEWTQFYRNPDAVIFRLVEPDAP